MARPLFSKHERAWLVAGFRVVSACALALLGLALLLAMYSYNPSDPGYFSATWRSPQNWLGKEGALVADLLHRTIGVAGYAIGALALAWALRIYLRAWPGKMLTRLVCAPLALLCLAAFASSEPEKAVSGGGLGGLFGDTLFIMVNSGLPLESTKIRYIAAVALLALLTPPLLIAAFGGDSWRALNWLERGRRDLAIVLGRMLRGGLRRWRSMGGAQFGRGLMAALAGLFAGMSVPRVATAGVADAPHPSGGFDGFPNPFGRTEPSAPPIPRRRRPIPKAPPASEPGFRTARRVFDEPGFSDDAAAPSRGPSAYPSGPIEPEISAAPVASAQTVSAEPPAKPERTVAPDFTAPPADAVPVPGWAARTAAAGEDIAAQRRLAEAEAAALATDPAPIAEPSAETINTASELSQDDWLAQNPEAAPELPEDFGDGYEEAVAEARAELSAQQRAEAERNDLDTLELGSPPRAAAPVEPAPVKAAPAPNLEPVAEPEKPGLDLLNGPTADTRLCISERALAEKADRLQSVLQDYGVRGDIIHVSPGPVVSLFELEPAPGLKSARVVGLADDIARSMSAAACRIAPVPGKNLIGIELPNDARETVLLSELLASEAYQGGDWTLPLALGKDIAGEPIIADLARMPHLLIAGTTGSGKSVAINTMLLSLLYRLSPADARLILIDPKMLELSVYNGAPHLLAPVVTDPQKAVAALRWVVREMEARYQRMARLNVRSLESYNARVEEEGDEAGVTREVQVGFCEKTGKPLFETQVTPAEKMARIVVVIDEMADLMLVAGKEIERLVQRLAQMARAAGIHLVMATQRPSVDVITGVIKANFPIRISFQVTSKIDSRTILNEPGAEQLLGKGDMLFTTGSGKLQRLHGPFVSDAEVEAVAAKLRAMGPVDEPIDFEARAETASDSGDDTGGSGDDSDETLYDKAVAIVASERKASTSFLQRRLQIGYNRAARLVDKMEAEGVISAANHVGKRDVLVDEAP